MYEVTFGAVFMAVLLEGLGWMEPLAAYATLVFLLPFFVAADVAIERCLPAQRWLDGDPPAPRAIARYRR